MMNTNVNENKCDNIQENQRECSILTLIYDTSVDSELKYKDKINSVFKHLHNLNKGIKFIENEEILILEIDNKYYQCSLQVRLLSLQEGEVIDGNFHTEGLIFFWNAKNLRTQKIQNILNQFVHKPTSNIVLFEEDHGHLNSYSEFEDFIAFSVDNNIEIISGITDFEDINEDSGVGALNMSLQTAQWSTSQLKGLQANKNKAEEEKAKTNSREKASVENGYKPLQEELEFDTFLEKMNGVRRTNMNESVSDDERRKNAENAILMLAKYLNLGEDEEEEHEENSEN